MLFWICNSTARNILFGRLKSIIKFKSLILLSFSKNTHTDLNLFRLINNWLETDNQQFFRGVRIGLHFCLFPNLIYINIIGYSPYWICWLILYGFENQWCFNAINMMSIRKRFNFTNSLIRQHIYLDGLCSGFLRKNGTWRSMAFSET